MSSITFVDYQTIIPASWLNDVNNMVYNGVVPATTLSPTNLSVSTNASIANITNNVVFTSTGAITLPNGTTAQEPGTPSAGMIRFNSTKTQFEGYNGSAWSSFGIVGGSNTQVQYNSSGALAGSANLTFDGTTLTANTLSVSTSTTTPIVQSSGSLLLKTNGTTTAVTINTSQQVGIGTSSPDIFSRSYTGILGLTSAGSSAIEVNAASGNTAFIDIGVNSVRSGGFQSDGSTMYFGSTASLPVIIQTGGTGRLTVDTNGNLGLGVTPSSWVSGAKALQFTGGSIWVQSTQIVMAQNYYYGSGNNYAITTSQCSDYSQYAGTHVWRIAPSTTAGASPSFTQAMTLLNNGQFCLGTTTQRGSCSFTLSTDSGTTQWSVGPYLSNSSQFYVASSGSTGVYLNGTSATSWSSNSDERLKTDLVPIANAVTKVNSLRSVTGRYNTDPTGTSRAFLIAQDVQAVLPEAVGTFQIPESEDKTEYLSLAYTELIPLLVASIKELSAQVTALQAKVGE